MAARGWRRFVPRGIFVLAALLAVVSTSVAIEQAAGASDGHMSASFRAGSVGAVTLAQSVPREYIVVLKDGEASPASVAADMTGRYGVSVSHIYDVSLKGFAATIPAG